jgi:hypothetical protein
MSRGLLASAAALAVAAVAALPAGGAPSATGLRVAIIGPQAAEAGSWTALRVDVANLGNEELDAHATLLLPYATTKPGEATGGRCSGARPVMCDLTLPEAASRWLTVPVRWQSRGMWSVEARVRSDATQTSTSLSAASGTTVAVYGLKLRGLQTAGAQAGARLVASGTLVRSDTGTPLRARLLRCAATVGGRPLRGAGRVAGTRVTCAWAVPAGTSGQSFRGTIAASAHPNGTPTRFPFVRRIG